MEFSMNYVNKETLTPKGNLIKSVKYKPTTPVIVMTVVGVACMLTFNMIAFLLGVVFLFFAYIVAYKVEDYVTVDFYESNMIVYNSVNHNLAFSIDYDDIKEWNINRSKSYAIYILLNNGYSFFIDTYQCGSAQKALLEVMPKKNSVDIRIEENRKRKFVFKNPFKK